MAAPTHHGVVAIVTNPDRTRFFIQRKDATYRPHPRGYSLFGGAIEQGEAVEDALVRELREELGPAAEPLIAAGLAPAMLDHTLATGFVLSLFEIVVDDAMLSSLATVPVFEGECGVVLDRAAMLATPWVWGLEELVVAYLERAGLG